MIGPTVTKRVGIQRKLYWTGWAIAVPLLAASGWHRGLKGVAIAAVACAFVAILYAYMFTPNIKIGGRVRTWLIARSHPDPPEDGSPPPPSPPPPPPDSYLGYVTATTLWWTVTVLAVMSGAGAAGLGWSMATIFGGALTSGLLAFLGHLDRQAQLPVARQQWVPLAVTAIASLPFLLIPLAIYFAAYKFTAAAEP
jgi:hypothetical protein